MTSGMVKLVAVCRSGLLFPFPKSGLLRTSSAEAERELVREEGADDKEKPWP